MKNSFYSRRWLIVLCLLLQVWALPLTAARESEEFSLLVFKRAIDLDNLRLVVQWLSNDLRSDDELTGFSTRLKNVEEAIYASVPATFDRVSYEHLIIGQLGSCQPLSALQERRVRTHIRYSVDYLNLVPETDIAALEKEQVITPDQISYSDDNNFVITAGFSPETKDLHPDVPHTIVDLQHYVHRRLGRVPVSQALLSGWDLHLFDTPAGIALPYLQRHGYREFYRVNNFYSQWGKRTYLAMDGTRTALVFTDVFGDFMRVHIASMLKMVTAGETRFDPEKIHFYHNLKCTAKEEMVKKYRRDIPWICGGKDAAVILGYLDILGETIRKRVILHKTAVFLKTYITGREKREIEIRLDEQGNSRLRDLFRHLADEQKPVPSIRNIRGNDYYDLLEELNRSCSTLPCVNRLNLYLTAKMIRPVHKRGKGEALEYDMFAFRDTKGARRYMINIGAMHSIFGDMAAEITRISLANGVSRMVFSGSAGALNTDYPYYALTIPETVTDHRGETVADFPDNCFNRYASPSFGGPDFRSDMAGKHKTGRIIFSTVHRGVVSPLMETQPMVRSMLGMGIDTVDVELAEVIKAIKHHPGATFGAALIVSDFPGAFLDRKKHHLDQVDYRKKYEIIPALVDLIFAYLDVEEVLYFDN